MRMILAAAPFEDFARENSPILAVIVCVILALLIARLITRTMTRLVLLGIVVLAGLFIVIERDNITECTQTCECRLAGFDTTIPACNAKLPRTGT
ncbi:hypothetical protein [Actinospongicola halichondriae]|uniref:hypothetical protein n=1 Tax=Actinospongicola halichondriae TaxID=3236844 RepID=UPI003D584E57